KNLERVHYIAWLIWIKLGTPVGLLSSLIASLLMLRVTRSIEDNSIIPPADREIAVWIISATAFAISAVLGFVLSKLCVFAKELWIVLRIYRCVPDVENVLDYLPEQGDAEGVDVAMEVFEDEYDTNFVQTIAFILLRQFGDAAIGGIAIIYSLVGLANAKQQQRGWLYLFFVTTFVVRVVLSEWMFYVMQDVSLVCWRSVLNGLYRCDEILTVQRQCFVLIAFLLHLCAVEMIGHRAEKYFEENLDRVHYIAWLIWMKFGTPVGLLSSLIASVLMLRVTRLVGDNSNISSADKKNAVAIMSTMAFVISAILAFVLSKLCVFLKEMWTVWRVYQRVPDIENFFEYLTEEEGEDCHGGRDEEVEGDGENNKEIFLLIY
ncbi:hypothetical protein HK100_006546, partial [Physocladia obscura]